MEEIKVTVAVENSGNNQEISEEEKSKKAEEERLKIEQERREHNEKVKEEAKKFRRATRPLLATKIRPMVKTVDESYDEAEVKLTRLFLRVFLSDLASHKMGKHMAVVIKLREAIREMQTIRLSENEALILAEAAARYEINLVRLKEKNDNLVQKM